MGLVRVIAFSSAGVGDWEQVLPSGPWPWQHIPWAQGRQLGQTSLVTGAGYYLTALVDNLSFGKDAFELVLDEWLVLWHSC